MPRTETMKKGGGTLLTAAFQAIMMVFTCVNVGAEMSMGIYLTTYVVSTPTLKGGASADMLWN